LPLSFSTTLAGARLKALDMAHDLSCQSHRHVSLQGLAPLPTVARKLTGFRTTKLSSRSLLSNLSKTISRSTPRHHTVFTLPLLYSHSASLLTSHAHISLTPLPSSLKLTLTVHTSVTSLLSSLTSHFRRVHSHTSPTVALCCSLQSAVLCAECCVLCLSLRCRSLVECARGAGDERV